MLRTLCAPQTRQGVNHIFSSIVERQALVEGARSSVLLFLRHAKELRAPWELRALAAQGHWDQVMPAFRRALAGVRGQVAAMPRLAAAWLSVLASIQQVGCRANGCACAACRRRLSGVCMQTWQMGPAVWRISMCGGPGHCPFQVWLSCCAVLGVLLQFICCPCQETWPLQSFPPVLGSSHAGQLFHDVVGPGPCPFLVWLSISADLRVLLRFICCLCQALEI